MAEDWLDCPALGPGWKRREVLRKSGVTCGRSDTYYESPTGDRIRSKVELTRYLGPACDLTLFDFKHGVLCYPAPKAHVLAVPSRKRKKPSRPVKSRQRQVGPCKGDVRKEAPGDETKADTDAAPASFPATGYSDEANGGLAGTLVEAEVGSADMGWGVHAPRAPCLGPWPHPTLCWQRVGCGECTACQVTEDCGACSTCLLQLPHDVASGLFCKCEQRRCLRIVERGRHGRRRGGCDPKIVARRHPQTQPLPPPPLLQPPESTELHPRALAPSSPAELIYYCVDEDELKRLLPSVWAGSEDGAELPSPYHCRRKPVSARRRQPGPTLESPLVMPIALPGRAQTSMKQETGGSFVLPPPGTDLVFLREGASSPVPVPGPALSTEAPLQESQCPGLSWVVAPTQVKQEKVDAQEDWTPGTAIRISPVLLPGCPSKAINTGLRPVKQEPPDPEEDKGEENRDDSALDPAPEEEAGGAGTPVITEIFSLGGTRFRDTAIWLPRLRKLLAVNENEYFTELQLKEEAL
uniref:Methyl-CpG-binding domain protein 1 n=1 Tax=Loxodonta africana TaxID=9785 RepID=G3UI85_LOXAF